MNEYIREFGIGIFAIAGFTRVLRKMKLAHALKAYERFKYKIIIHWLDKRYGKEVDKVIAGYSSHCKIQEDSPIWVFWWQGGGGMPPVVRSCYESILRNAEKHPVILITKNNVSEYVDIPEYIYEKIEEKKMTLTHFSDILRENLMYKHGGIWMDATLYMTSPFPGEIYQYEYYSIKGAYEEWEWTGFFQASGQGNVFAKAVSHLFNCYWQEHNCLISYLLIDCLMTVARMHSTDIDWLVHELPRKDSSIFLLGDGTHLDKIFDENEMDEICKKSNIHKLSYKYKHSSLIGEKKTFWGELLKES